MSDVSLNVLNKEKPVPLWPNDGSEAFDYDEVERRLSADSGTMSRDEVEAAFAVSAVIRWAVSTNSGRTRSLKIIGLRVSALAWLLDHDGVGVKSASLLAKRFGVSQQEFSSHIAEASKLFNLRNRFQAHGRKHSQN